MTDGVWPCNLSDPDAATVARFRDRQRPLPAGVSPMAPEFRRGLWVYRALGFVGECATAAMIYLVNLEDDLVRREAMDRLRREAAEAFR